MIKSLKSLKGLKSFAIYSLYSMLKAQCSKLNAHRFFVPRSFVIQSLIFCYLLLNLNNRKFLGDNFRINLKFMSHFVRIKKLIINKQKQNKDIIKLYVGFY